MKWLLTILSLFAICNIKASAQQNHVPNGNFEQYTSCPTGFAQINNCTGWSSWNWATPDYYHFCHTGPTGPSIPANTTGYQFPVSGSAYIGLFSHAYVNTKEYITRSITPLQTGKMYTVSLYVSLAEMSHGGTNDIGVYFYVNTPKLFKNSKVASVSPQVEWPNMVITDTQNWVHLTKIFIADSSYDNIAIGGFRYQTSINFIPFNASSVGLAYYYIDSVEVLPFNSHFFVFDDTLQCAGDTLTIPYYSIKRQSNNTFTMQLSNANGSFSSPVNVGSTNSDTSANIMVVIPPDISPGNGYRLRLVSSNAADTSEDNGFDIIIHNPDSASVVVSTNSPLCEGNTLNFSASTNVSPTKYSWSGPNNFSDTTQSPSISGAVLGLNGYYFVNMKFYGCEVNDTVQVTVIPKPNKPSLNATTPICSGDSLRLFSSTTTTGVTYSWTGPNSFSDTVQNPAIANSATTMSGIYMATVSKYGCDSSDTISIQVMQSPASVTLSNNTPFCSGDTLKLNSTMSTTGATYSWSGPGSFSANTRNAVRPNSISSVSGWYKILVDLNGCTYKDSTYANIYLIPSVQSIGYVSPICIDDTLKLNGQSSINGATYSWTGPSNYSSSQQNPQKVKTSFNDSGKYYLSVTYNGCTSPKDSVQVQVNPQPFVVILANKDSICDGQQVNFTSFPNNHGGTPTYQWYVNAQLVSTGTTFGTATLKQGDVVRCDMTEYTKCSNAFTDPSNDVSVTVMPWMAPSVSITANPSGPLKPYEYVTFTAVATDAGNPPLYQWKRNGTDVIGAQGNTWAANTLNDNDRIHVEVTSTYMCPQPTIATSNNITVQILTSIGDVEDEQKLILYPNPNNGTFVLSGKVDSKEELSIDIVNALGQRVYSTTIRPDNGTFRKEISLNTIADGAYLIRLYGAKEAKSLHFIKK